MTGTAVPKIDDWQIVRLHWKAQALANILFGLSLSLVYMMGADFPLETTVKLGILYVAIYLCVYVPVCGLLPFFLFRPVKVFLKEWKNAGSLSEERIISAVKVLLDLPLNSAAIIGTVAFSGFLLGAVIVHLGFIAQLGEIREMVVAVVLAIGAVVAIIHGFLNYVFLEGYLQPLVEFFVSGSAGLRQASVGARKLSIFSKILILILMTTLAIQFSLGGLFLSTMAFRFPQEFSSSAAMVAVVVVLGFSYVAVIASTFTKNLTYPLKRIILWAGEIRRGGTKRKNDLITNDEISLVIEYLTEMVEDLEQSKKTLEIRVQARTRELRELAAGLEGQVTERTKELQKRLEDLERFNKLTVGRELKMLELKKEIVKLRQQLEEKKVDKLS